MKLFRKHLAGGALVLVQSIFGLPMFAQDAPGTSDHPAVSRFQGSRLRWQNKADYDAYPLPLGRAQVGNKFKKQLSLEGKVTRTRYTVGNGVTIFQILKTYEAQLKRAGFQILYTCSGWDCEEENRNAYLESILHISGDPAGRMEGTNYLSAELSKPQGKVYVSLFVSPLESQKDLFYELDVIEPAPLDTNNVKVTAENMASTMATEGKVAVYGIYFDNNHAEVKPESEETISEIAKMLKSRPALKLLVVGHTDAVGTLASNMDLSQKRASAVVEVLIKRHGIDAKRLAPVGVGYAAPVAPNSSEDGRAKNRRVELMEQI
jgi:outer membrane protein OmpA-like peptidoglycan-associated protein